MRPIIAALAPFLAVVLSIYFTTVHSFGVTVILQAATSPLTWTLCGAAFVLTYWPGATTRGRTVTPVVKQLRHRWDISNLLQKHRNGLTLAQIVKHFRSASTSEKCSATQARTCS
jgi:hypothetical protein